MKQVMIVAMLIMSIGFSSISFAKGHNMHPDKKVVCHCNCNS